MKRHEFEAIAAALKSSRPANWAPGENAVQEIMRRQHAICSRAIADALARGTAPGGNRAFDRDLFLRNAGVTP